jgi:hypothetical protein
MGAYFSPMICGTNPKKKFGLAVSLKKYKNFPEGYNICYPDWGTPPYLGLYDVFWG